MILGDFSWLSAFQPAVNRQFLPPTFPRDSKMIPRSDALAYLRNVLNKLTCIICELADNISNIEYILVCLMLDIKLFFSIEICQKIQ